MKNYFREFDLSFDGEIKNIMMDENVYKQNVNGSVYTTYHIDLFSDKEQKINQYIENLYPKVFDDFMVEINLYKWSMYDFTYWWQVYEEDSCHPIHNHHGPQEIFSWVHFIEVDESDPCFYYVDHYDNKHFLGEKSDRLIIFPSWLMHGVKTPKSKRAVVAGNIYLKSIETHDKSN